MSQLSVDKFRGLPMQLTGHLSICLIPYSRVILVLKRHLIKDPKKVKLAKSRERCADFRTKFWIGAIFSSLLFIQISSPSWASVSNPVRIVAKQSLASNVTETASSSFSSPRVGSESDDKQQALPPTRPNGSPPKDSSLETDRFLQEGRYREAIGAIESDLRQIASASAYFNLALAELRLAKNGNQSPLASQGLQKTEEKKSEIEAGTTRTPDDSSVVSSSVPTIQESGQSAVHSLVGKDILLSRAYFHFLQARSLAPRSSDIDYYLKEFETSQGGGYFKSSNFEKKFFVVSAFLSEREIWYFSAVLMFLSAIVFLIPEILDSKTGSRSLRYVGIFLFGLSVYFLVAASKDKTLRDHWAVTKSSSSIRSQPTADGSIIKDIPQTFAVKILRENPFWFFAELSSGEKGWVRKDDLIHSLQ